MKRRSQTVEESGPKVPAYIVTFSDMVTLLLTFFVMLLTLAKVQDSKFFDVSQKAFIQNMDSVGLGRLMGEDMSADLNEAKVKYFISNPDPEEKNITRTIDARGENLRRIFKKVTQSMETKRSQIVAGKTSFSVTSISFSPGQAGLNESAKKFLTQFVSNLQVGGRANAIKRYVLGLTNDVKGEKNQWILSAMRAQAASDFLESILPKTLRWPVYSWGAGPGGYWVAGDSHVSRQSQILIAVLRAND